MAFLYTLLKKFMKSIRDVTQSMITLSAYVTSALERGYAENLKWETEDYILPTARQSTSRKRLPLLIFFDTRGIPTQMTTVYCI